MTEVIAAKWRLVTALISMIECFAADSISAPSKASASEFGTFVVWLGRGRWSQNNSVCGANG
jgi:hypothetical protein